jgi:hypothetical protein
MVDDHLQNLVRKGFLRSDGVYEREHARAVRVICGLLEIA